VCEDRFSLIVRRVSDGDARCAPFLNYTSEKCIAKAPRCVLEIPPVLRGCSGNVFMRVNQFQFARARHFRNKLSIGLRFRSSKRVVEMNHEQNDSECMAKIFEEPEQRDRICAA
jgi:hypothetical protein